jgi:hypothetical protein
MHRNPEPFLFARERVLKPFAFTAVTGDFRETCKNAGIVADSRKNTLSPVALAVATN